MTIPLEVRRRVLVRGVNWVGDAIIATPALAHLRRIFAGSHITMMVRPWVAAVYEHNADVDELWVEDDSLSPRRFMAAANRVRKGRFDFGIAMPNSFRSALLLAAGRVRYRVGHDTARRSMLLSKAVKIEPKLLKEHQVHYYMNLVQWLGDERPQPPKLVLASGQKERGEVKTLLEEKGVSAGRMWIGLAPGAINSQAKQWLPERFAELADRFNRELKAEVMLLGSDKEKRVAREVEKLCKAPVYNLAGELSLAGLIALMERLHAFVGNDSGAMHVAAAFSVPSVALWGPTDWRTTAPFSRYSKIVRHEVECSPCMLRRCPIDHPCMTGIHVEEVVRTFTSLAPQIKERMKGGAALRGTAT